MLGRSVVSISVTPWTVVCQVPLSVEFPRQEYCSGLPFPTPGDLPNPGIKPVILALAGGFFTTEPPVQFSSVAQSCPTLCDPMNRSMPGLPAHHQLPPGNPSNKCSLSQKESLRYLPETN